MARKAIPSEHHETLRAFVQLDDKLTQKFVEALKASEPRLLISSLANKVAAASGVEKTNARAFLLMLASMSRARASAEKKVDAFLTGVRDAALEEGTLSTEDAETHWSRAAKHLAAALQTKAVAISSKALAIMTSNERMLCRVRIVSDLRPVFNDELEPDACVVLHQLKLAFHEQENFDDASEIFITLDRDDLMKLQAAVMRALQKDTKLIEMGKALDLQVLTAKE